MTDRTMSRRELLRLGGQVGLGLAGAGVLAACGGSSPTAQSSPGSSSAALPTTDQVVIRSPGGTSEVGYRKAWWDPFTADTGIKVVLPQVSASAVVAQYLAGTVTIDIPNLAVDLTIQLQRVGALQKLDKARFERSKLTDMDLVTDHYVSKLYYSSVIGYNTQTFPTSHPGSWADFWDVGKFPGPRSLQDAASEYPDLEMALLADGVAIDKLYPLNLDRAFKSMSRIRKSIVKFWDSGALSAQLMADKQAVLTSIWEARVYADQAAGVPISIEWNQARRYMQAFQIAKGAPNLANAYKVIDYGMQPEVQAAMAKIVGSAPATQKAYSFIDAKTTELLCTAPDHVKKGFNLNMDWWASNHAEVNTRWREFLLNQ